jgi:enamine deaminase RidA (YjgF/YER057c/UK114 family)
VPHEYVNPPALGRPVGFSHGILAAAGGRLLFLGGQNGDHAKTADFAKQFDAALDRIVAVIQAAGGQPADLALLNIYVTNRADYAKARAKLAEIWKRRLGRHYPACALFVVKGLWEKGAKVELEGIAVLPAAGAPG